MRTMTLLLVSLLLIACVESATQVGAEASKSWAEARSAALTAIEIAANKGHAWTTSDQLIDEADKAVRDGNESLAISLADEARIHAELAVQQADREATAWRDNLISN